MKTHRCPGTAPMASPRSRLLVIRSQVSSGRAAKIPTKPEATTCEAAKPLRELGEVWALDFNKRSGSDFKLNPQRSRSKAAQRPLKTARPSRRWGAERPRHCPPPPAPGARCSSGRWWALPGQPGVARAGPWSQQAEPKVDETMWLFLSHLDPHKPKQILPNYYLPVGL